MNSIRRLVVPSLALLFLVVVAYLRPDLLEEFQTAAFDRTQVALALSLQIGLWIIGAFFVDRVFKVLIWEGLVRKALGVQVPRLVQELFTVLLFVLALIGVVGVVFGRSVTGIWATTGGVGIVVGFALRNMIHDVFAGIALNIERPIKIGDWIWIHDRDFDDPETSIGCVTEINWRTTRLKTIENNTLVLPNSQMSEAKFTNFSVPSVESRFELFVSLDASVPASRALRVLNAALLALVEEGVLIRERKSKAKADGLDHLGVRYKLKYWIRPAEVSPSTARHRVLTSVLDQLSHAGIGLAYPKTDLFHAPMPARQLDSQSLEDRTELLARISLFAEIEEDERRILARSMQERFLDRGGELTRQGEPGSSMFILVEGLLQVLIDLRGEGSEEKVGQILPGAFLGEMSALTGEDRSATVRAATDAVVYEITRDALAELLEGRPEIAETMSRAVANHRLEDKQARSQWSEVEKEEETRTAARQIMDRMMSFFRGVPAT